MKNFIKTTDKETAAILLSLGFEMLSEEKDCYVFLNQEKLNFCESSMPKHCVYTDILCI